MHKRDDLSLAAASSFTHLVLFSSHTNTLSLQQRQPDDSTLPMQVSYNYIIKVHAGKLIILHICGRWVSRGGITR